MELLLSIAYAITIIIVYPYTCTNEDMGVFIFMDNAIDYC